jgi:hypothetical protein
MPFVSVFNSTTHSLSNMMFSSRKNYDTNLMEQGYLATLTPGTVLIIDETNMVPGKIINNGVKNIKALATLIEEQQVELDFQYYQQMLPVTIPVLVLSETRSMLKNTIHVPVSSATDADILDVRFKVQ